MKRWGRRTGVGADAEFTFDGTPDQRFQTCDDCGEEHEGRTGFVQLGGRPHAVYFADWYPHTYETYVDVVMGSFAGPDHDDNVTFHCRYGHVDGQAEIAASLVPPLRHSGAIMGRAIDREAALQHPLLPDMWRVTDWLVENDDLLHRTVFHAPPRPAAG
ncbi:hypothetical protein AERO_08575 [Aeromicrobium fastidiosum]|nr:hypothetical protein [Aeromicrobium fastidiosum]